VSGVENQHGPPGLVSGVWCLVSRVHGLGSGVHGLRKLLARPLDPLTQEATQNAGRRLARPPTSLNPKPQTQVGDLPDDEGGPSLLRLLAAVPKADVGPSGIKAMIQHDILSLMIRCLSSSKCLLFAKPDCPSSLCFSSFWIQGCPPCALISFTPLRFCVNGGVVLVETITRVLLWAKSCLGESWIPYSMHETLNHTLCTRP
jgi:hypothetical protein